MTDFDERMDASGGEYYVVDNEQCTVTRGSDRKKLDLTPEFLLELGTEKNPTVVFNLLTQFFERAE